MANYTPEFFLENLKTELIDILSMPEVIAELGSEAVALSRVAEGLFVPALKKGKFRMPRDLADTEAIGVVLNPPDRDFLVHKSVSRSSPNQRRQIEKTFIERMLALKTQDGIVADRSAVLASSYAKGKTIESNSGQNPFVVYDAQIMGISSEELVMVRSRPVISLPVKDVSGGHGIEELYGLAHEVEHARQLLAEPARVFEFGSYLSEMVDDTAERELRAYRVGLVTATKCDYLGRNWSHPSVFTDLSYLWVAYQIESARLRHGGGPDSFDITREMAAELYEKKLLAAVVYQEKR